jgi:type II secretory ATPase GspE/PulE/Tfp pilus assembly ATPase PilB-like protein
MAQRLGDMLVDEGLLSPGELEKAQQASRSRRLSLPQVLLQDGVVAEDALLRVLGRLQGLPFVRLAETAVDEAAIRALSAKFVAHYRILPVRLHEGTLTLAVSSPFDLSAVEDVETNYGLRVERVLATTPDIADAVQRYYGVGAGTVERILADRATAPEARPVEALQDLEKAAEDVSVVSFVNQVLHQAIRDRASDVHFEIYRDQITMRRRVDGVLYDTPVPGSMALLYPAVVSRIKLMAGLNIVERRLPQDGRARVSLGASQYDLRVSVVPTLHGEDVVVRILPTTMLFSLEQLGLSEAHLKTLAEIIRQPHGILFVTGPTGSGKSTTLYACLSRLNVREHKIITIEDPVEYEIQGIMQTQINPAVGLTFARALRSMLRHDPDIMMVGEVRDGETAEVTIQTALTGHLVFSTLHTNDAASAAIRLMDMGVDPYLITSTVLAFLAQRLVRVNCAHCRQPVEEQGRHVLRGRGCSRCRNTGYHGRLAISEILRLTPGVQDLVLRRASAHEIRQRAVAEGMRTLADDGWDKIAQGLTTPEEVLRVTALARGPEPVV